MKGTIKRLISEKGFGFIAPEGGEKDVFFHNTGLVGVQFADLKIDDVVTFEMLDDVKGPKAVNVTRA